MDRLPGLKSWPSHLLPLETFAGFSAFLNYSIHICKTGIISSVLETIHYTNIY